MDTIIQNLSELFPAKYHNYHLVETAGGISIKTLSYIYYVLPFLILSFLLYYLVLWEGNKWEKNFKLYFSTLPFVICLLVAGFFSFIPLFLIFGHEITRVDFNTKEKKIIVYGVILSETIPFDKIENLTISTNQIKSYKGSGSSLVHNLEVNKKIIMNFNFGDFNYPNKPEYKAFESYADKLTVNLKKLINTDKLMETIPNYK